MVVLVCPICSVELDIEGNQELINQVLSESRFLCPCCENMVSAEEPLTA